jgi:hypothetical protein
MLYSEFSQHAINFLKVNNILDKGYQLSDYFFKYDDDGDSKDFCDMQKFDMFRSVIVYLQNRYNDVLTPQTKDQVYDLYDQFIVYLNNHNIKF